MIIAGQFLNCSSSSSSSSSKILGYVSNRSSGAQISILHNQRTLHKSRGIEQSSKHNKLATQAKKTNQK